MSRARAVALCLVNWKGVFFERYQLDRHVTALEGGNGAGKTTVMVAAYVVLLPDLQRLKFVNVGESGATGGDRGIWGRLGEEGPSYAALEIELEPGQRVLCGVLLERKAAPSLSLTPFLISPLPATLTAHELLLATRDGQDEIPTLSEVGKLAAARGASCEVFGSVREYFSRLFELGIGALRLSTDEERNKLNDMLRTSMTGGISRTLTNDLRSFLFKRESGLFDTLSRMRQNLDACRRTRLEVSEARALEHEIGGIYTAGHAMFLAALGASRQRAREARAELARLEQASRALSQRALELETLESELSLRKASLEPRLTRARATEEAARERLQRLGRVHELEQRVLSATAARAQLLEPAELALEHKREQSAERERAKLARDAAQATLLRAAAGVASLQAGLEELHRQSHAFGRVRQLLAQAQRLLGELAAEGGAQSELAAQRGALAQLGAQTAEARAALGPGALEETLSTLLPCVREARQRLDRERAERHRQASSAEQRRAERSAALGALASLIGHPPDEESAGARARQELSRLNHLELLATRARELEQEWQRLSALGRRQQALQRELGALGYAPLPSARDFANGLAELERSRREHEQRQREHERAAERESERAQAGEARLEALRARAERFARVAQFGARLAQRELTLPRSASELSQQLRALDEQRHELGARARRCAEERQSALAQAQALEASSEGFDAALASLAERLEGKLLASSYEELELDDARRMQAELGPLLRAIVVEDPERALSQLGAQPHGQEHVWLVRAGAWPPPERPHLGLEVPGHVVSDLGFGLRVTPLPFHVQLGKAARERRVRELRAQADRQEQELEQLQRELAALEATRTDLERLWEHWDVWSSGDPAAELASTEAELETARAQVTEHQRLGREERLAAARLRTRQEGSQPHLGDHHLLDPPDYTQQAEAARAELERARGASAELERSREARALLLVQLHQLDEPAPDAALLATWQREQPLLDAQRDRLFALAEALEQLSAQRAAWAWSEAERALAEQTQLVPELDAQHERARLEAERLQAQFQAAESAWEQATAEAQRAAAELAAADAQLSRAQSELSAERAALGRERSELGASVELEQCQLELREATAAVERLRAEERSSDAELALAAERLQEARQQEQHGQRQLALERERCQPLQQAAEELLEAARAASVFEEPASAVGEAATSAQLWLEAQAKRTLLCDRLESARGATELAQAAREAWPDSAGSPNPGVHHLHLWLAVRSWLLERLPAPLGELAEPLLGLSRLQSDLAQLERRLERQEGDLRGTSGDVARSIDVQLRRAAAQVRRLNAALEGIRFGSIHGIRVQMERVTKMEQVLRALREGETQELLFQSDLPIEAALDEIFRRHSGGRSGGQRLIDYREYLDLCVAIQRRTGADWERVNPSQVSTGEAIGVGAALMMVILAEWEREDQLLRRQKALGSLRFLFLDEANRLSQDNLGVLFDLCRTLDLQLLIAAPEVARAEGNTTYRLVRRVNEQGREEVLVTGRRTSLPEPASTPPDDGAPSPSEVVPRPEPVQEALFGAEDVA